MSKHDRSKSGGILDTLFSRPSKKGNRTYNYANQTLNGGRPVSLEADGASFESLQIQVTMMTLEEVNKKFSEILEDMNIPADKREPLLLKNVNEKKEMILMHMKGMWWPAHGHVCLPRKSARIRNFLLKKNRF
jgi:hypothetical protein